MSDAELQSPRQFRGRMVRTLTTTARTATETFWLDGLGEAESWWSPASVIAERDVSGPAEGPILLWDEVVGNEPHVTALLDGYFAGNLAAWCPPTQTERDTTGLKPVDDDEFWGVIEILGGKTWEKTIDAAARSLATRDEEFVLRWQETTALKAVALDEQFRKVDEDHAGFPTALAVLGATIARGPETYESVRADPDTFDAKWLNDAASGVLFVGSLALRRKLGEDVHVTTSFTPLHMRLLRAWEAEIDEREAESRRLSPDPESLRWKTFHAGRALIREGGDVRLRIVIAEDLPGAGDHRNGLREALESFGGSLCSPVETQEGGLSGIGSGPVFEVKRRFTGTRDEYLGRFVRPRH
ncbi:hypothetical protein [Demequina sp.]|uniref:hypothetical protein n=1 Tax=Demequina sp. TaxID=2050685 RepID=UPI003D09769B